MSDDSHSDFSFSHGTELREISHATDQNVNSETFFVMSTTLEAVLPLRPAGTTQNSRAWTVESGLIHVKPVAPETANEEDMKSEELQVPVPRHVVSMATRTCERENAAEPDKDAVSIITLNQGNEDEVECRICQSRGEESLANPCHCDGSTKWVHESCLLKWFRVSGSSSCELCSQKIRIKKIIRPVRQWRCPSGGITGGTCLKVDIWYTFLTLFSIGTIIGFAVFQRRVQTSDPQTIGVFAIIYILCILMIIARMRYFFLCFVHRSMFWQKWKTLNEEWTLIDKGAVCEPVDVSVV